MKYNELNLGQMEAIVNKLGGMEGVQRFLSGELTVSAVAKDWKTWRTIKLGTGLNPYSFRTALKEADCGIMDSGNDILGKLAFTVSKTEAEVELVNVSVAELGFKDYATRVDIYKRANELGLDLCPAEVGPQLRLQYKDQPKGERCIIGMEPITGSGGNLRIFVVEHSFDGKHLLFGNIGIPDIFWNGLSRWVFLRRK